jgi:hypothetical protein
MKYLLDTNAPEMSDLVAAIDSPSRAASLHPDADRVLAIAPLVEALRAAVVPPDDGVEDIELFAESPNAGAEG